jgi:hypothetical protein
MSSLFIVHDSSLIIHSSSSFASLRTLRFAVNFVSDTLNQSRTNPFLHIKIS